MRAFLFLACLVCCAPTFCAPSPASPTALAFSAAKPKARVQGAVVGYETKDYVFSAKKGQMLTLRLKSRPRPVEIHLIEPVEALLDGVDPYIIPQDGKYHLRLGMSRAHAQKTKKTTFNGNISLGDPRVGVK